jgi:hypothetical protein
MRAEAPRLSDWLILICSFTGAAFFAIVSFQLVLQIISGQGSPAGNALRIAAAAMSLMTLVICVTFGTLYWKSFYKPARKSIVQ